jgi:hypothetical protein
MIAIKEIAVAKKIHDWIVQTPEKVICVDIKRENEKLAYLV